MTPTANPPDSKPTIVFIHRGIATYLLPLIFQARLTNPESRIVLIVDSKSAPYYEAFKKTFDLDVAYIHEYSSEAARFEALYRHEGSNTEDYERFCFARWFILFEFIEKKGIDTQVVHLDSDAIVYLPVQKVFESDPTSPMIVCNKVGPMFLFFRSRDDLHRYCQYILHAFSDMQAYQKLKEYVSELNNTGLPHVSDMATLGAYSQENGFADAGDKTRTDFFFCENVNYPQEMEMTLYGKRIIHRNGKWFFRRESGGLLLAGGVHLQGSAKSLWPLYVQKEALRFLTPKIIVKMFGEILRRIVRKLG